MLMLLYRVNKFLSYIKHLVVPKSGAEYIVYTFPHARYEPNREHLKNWSKHKSLNDIKEAINVAENLFLSGQYIRVEVKQRYLNKNNQRIDKVYFAYDSQQIVPLYNAALLLGSLIISIAISAFMYVIVI